MPVDSTRVYEYRTDAGEIVRLVAAEEEDRGGSCRGCETPKTGLLCHTMPSCNGRIWKQAKVHSTPDLYAGAYARLQYQRRKEESSNPNYHLMIYWAKRAEDRPDQVESLQDMIRAIRKWDAFRMPKAIRYALRSLGMPMDWHKLALEFPADADNGSISYFGSERKALQYHETLREAFRTTTTLGRYIRRHWPDVEDHLLRDIVALYGPAQVEIVTDMATMVEAAQRGPQSCMKLNYADSGRDYIIYDDEHDEPSDEDDSEWYKVDFHPYEAYDPALGWAMAITRKEGKISARAIIHQPTKSFVRSYGKDSEGSTCSDSAIEAYLKSKGYKFLAGWPQGVKLKALPAGYRSGHILPYVDPAPSRAEENAKRFKYDESEGVYVKDPKGDWVLESTNGKPDYDPSTGDCMDCGASTNGRYVFAGLNRDHLVCQTCERAHYVSAYVGSNSRWVRLSQTIQTRSGYFYTHQAVTDGTVVVLYDGEYERRSRSVETSSGWVPENDIAPSHSQHTGRGWVTLACGEVVRRADARFCEHRCRWMAACDVKQVLEGVWISKDRLKSYFLGMSGAEFYRRPVEMIPDLMPHWLEANPEPVTVPSRPEVVTQSSATTTRRMPNLQHLIAGSASGVTRHFVQAEPMLGVGHVTLRDFSKIEERVMADQLGRADGFPSSLERMYLNHTYANQIIANRREES